MFGIKATAAYTAETLRTTSYGLEVMLKNACTLCIEQAHCIIFINGNI